MRQNKKAMNELLTIEQAAEKLQMHPETVRRLLRKREIPGVKLGRREWRIPADALREYFSRQLAGQGT
jgi:excisionase family DNA binding protein